MRSILLVAFAAAGLSAGPASDIANQIRKSGLDTEACYRVRDLRFVRDEIKLYFNDGYLIFGSPVNGLRVSAVFTTEGDGGNAELLLMPPFLRERKSLAAFAHAPNLSERFQQAIMIFTDEAASELFEMVKATGAKHSAEMGRLLSDRWTPVLRSFLGSFEVRLVEDLLSPYRKDVGFFFSALGGTQLGNFDVIYDPRARHQVSAGQVAFRDDRRYFDVWTNFEAQSWRTGRRKGLPPEPKIHHVRIHAVIEPDLGLKAVTRLQVTPARTERSLAFELSRRVGVTGVKVDGEPAEAFSPESLRANLLRSSDNNIVLVTREREFPAGKAVAVELEHEGNVILRAGNTVFFVGARGNWYPNRSLQFADYEATFRFPKQLDLVATGDLAGESEEGDWKISRRKTTVPVRLFGFNLGDYERVSLKRSGINVEVCANRKLETALQPRPRPIIDPMPPFGPSWNRGGRRTQPTPELLLPPIPPSPTARLQQVASEIASTLQEMASRIGMPPLQTLTVSPIPGRFGQGFPGLVYLSTISYLDPSERPQVRTGVQQMFYSEILHGHEIAHQWWGNGVTSADYQDDWLMEALANYSALWVLEHKKGARALDAVLEEYKNNLLKKEDDGRTIESAGPITMGHRLYSSLSPASWSLVTYEKGSWILHMIRRRMGDERFSKMLSALYSRNMHQAITTEQFRATAREFLPPGSVDPKLDEFFEHWVHGTGIPSLKLSWTTTGKAPRVKLTGTITQSDVDEDFSIWTPVEIHLPRRKPLIKWVRTNSDAEKFEVTLPAAPVRVVLDPGNATLARK